MVRRSAMSRASRVRRYLMVVLVLLLGVSLAAALFFAVNSVEEERARAAFEQRARLVAASLENGMEAQIELLRTVKALERIASAGAAMDPNDPTQTAFRELARENRQRHPGVVGFWWALRIPENGRAGIEAMIGAPVTDFRGGDRTAGVAPAPQRAEYYPMIFREPEDWVGLPLGIDAGADPILREGMDRAINSGQTTATAPVDLPGGRLLFVVMPGYNRDAALATADQRRAALIGFLVQVIHVDQFVSAALGGHDSDDVRLRIEDRTGDQGDGLVAVRDPDGGDAANLHPQWSGILLLAGRRWQLAMAPSSANVTSARPWQPLAVGGMTLAVTVMLVVYLVVTINRAERIARLAADRQREIEERQRAEETLRARESWFRGVVQNSSDLILVVDVAGKVTYVSPSVTPLFGYTQESLPFDGPREFVHPDDLPAVNELIARTMLHRGQVDPIDVRTRHTDGAWHWVEMTATNLLPDPNVRGIVLNIRDISERKRLEEQLTRQAFIDSLTSLPNRPLFMDRVAHTVAASWRRNERPAIVLLDLDGFKVVNDSLGHGAGDALLVAAGERMAAAVRPGDTVGRFGGDEFAVLLESLDGPDPARQLVEQMLEALRAPFVVEGREVFISASAGIAYSRREGITPSELLRVADIALYRAKASGKDCAVVFDQAMEREAVRRLDLETDLRRALERGEFQVYYQPEVEPSSGMVTGAEALVRWQHPERGLVSPADFIPLAEETGVILALGAWVLRQSCTEVQQWRAKGYVDESFALSVNLSGRQLATPELVGEVQAVLAESGLDPASLRLEITETVLMEDGPASARTLEGLKALGVELAIDDFGTGYSSLAYLQRFPVDTVKIDRSFIANVGDDARARAIVHTVTHLAHVLGMRVTAEGIETELHVEFVANAGCDRGQGYFYSRPLPAAEMLRLFGRKQEHAA